MEAMTFTANTNAKNNNILTNLWTDPMTKLLMVRFAPQTSRQIRNTFPTIAQLTNSIF